MATGITDDRTKLDSKEVVSGLAECFFYLHYCPLKEFHEAMQWNRLYSLPTDADWAQIEAPDGPPESPDWNSVLWHARKRLRDFWNHFHGASQLLGMLPATILGLGDVPVFKVRAQKVLNYIHIALYKTDPRNDDHNVAAFYDCSWPNGWDNRAADLGEIAGEFYAVLQSGVLDEIEETDADGSIASTAGKKPENGVGFRFHRDGPVVNVQFGDEAFALNAALIGTRFVGDLFHKPYEPIACSVLRSNLAAFNGKQFFHEQKVNDREIEVLREEITRRGMGLQELVNERDAVPFGEVPRGSIEIEIAEEQAKIEAIQKRVKQLTGLSGEARQSDKDRIAVKSAIDKLVEKAKVAGGIAFARHIEDYIETGEYCCYRPIAPAPAWNF